MFLGVDTGGTFTDFVLFDGDRLRFHKELSTPDDPSRAIEQGIAALGLNATALHLAHGSTVATNAILEGKGVKTLFVTNRGLEDLLAIGRQTRPELYGLTGSPMSVMQRSDAKGVTGRIAADGSVVVPLNDDELAVLSQHVSDGDYQAIAVCMLFSFLNPQQEHRIGKALPESLFLSLSHRVFGEYREYERGATTWVNAYVGPLVQRYLRRLAHVLKPKHLLVMHSAGGVMSAEAAGEQAARLVLSGPAGGLVAAREVGQQLHEDNLLTFDMGGTSTDVALIRDGAATLTTDGSIAGMPVSLPMLDIHTIGAGGGSIAWVDAAGLPQVGPESAGAAPGPVCYGLGGRLPTVTDANLLLGRIPPDAKLGGSMPLDREAARAAFMHYGEALQMSPEAAAEAVLAIAEAHMAAALRVVSVQRGHNPADFALLCFGGAGGLHACAVAEALAMRRVIVPLASGAFSALGMLAGRQQGEFSRTHRMEWDAQAFREQIEAIYAELAEQAVAGMPGLALSFERRLDINYAGQGFQLTVDYGDGDPGAIMRRFEAAHMQAYGHLLDRCLEVMTLRLTAYVVHPPLAFPELARGDTAVAPCDSSEVHAIGRVPHYAREQLRPGVEYEGPALIVESTSTLWLPPAWRMQVSEHGHLLLEQF